MKNINRIKNLLKKVLKYSFILLIILSLFLLIADHIWFSDYYYPPPHLKMKNLFPLSSQDSSLHALIINGGISPENNHARYWNNTSLFYSTLKAIGFADITVLHTDGLSHQKDRLTRSFMGYVGMGDPVDSPKDLDLDGTDDISGEATREELEKKLLLIGKKLSSPDKLLIFITDHGKLKWDKWKLRAVVCLWNNEILFGSEFNKIIKKSIPPEIQVTIIASQCYGERFLSEIDRKNTVLINSGSFLGFMWSNQFYGIFPRNLCSALLQRDIRTGKSIKSDLDHDGKVSMAEAFEWARNNDPQPKPPVMKIIGDNSCK